MSGPSELAAAKLRVMAAVPYVQKNRAAGLNYSFAGERAFIDKLHPAMVENGLTICPERVDLLANERFQTAKGSGMVRVLIAVTFRLTHAYSGQSEAIQTLGEAADTGDKAANKAMTAAMKYALRQAFLVETGDDPDEHPSAPMEAAPPPARAAQRPANGLPATGVELLARVRKYDAALAARKTCKLGELLAHVAAAGEEAGYGDDISQWSGSAIPFAVEAVKRFEASVHKPEVA